MMADFSLYVFSLVLNVTFFVALGMSVLSDAIQNLSCKTGNF